MTDAAFTTGSFGFTYDALSRRTQMTRPNGVTTDYAYDNLSRLLSVLHKLSGGTIDGATYTVDAVGNRTAKVNQLPSGPTENYTYDAIYQLTQVVQNGSTTTESYSYDGVGNRLSSLAASPWNYNVSNQLTSIAGSPGTTFTYDNNGNTTSKTDAAGATTYTWDYGNRLTSVTLPNSGGTVSFSYDPLGRRIRKVFGSATTIYAYDGENIVEETDASGTAVARYAMGLNIDEPLAMLRSGATHYYSADGLGSITSLTDGSGAVAASYTYDAFGSLAASSGSVVNPFRYTARVWDGETALYHYRARSLNPSSGRFLSEDSERFQAAPNFFPYVWNRPTNLIDPWGTFPTDFHRQITRDLAKAIFGPKCPSYVDLVVNANAWEDNIEPTFSGLFQFLTGTGDGWRRGGAHFPTQQSVKAKIDQALAKCDATLLGQGLHSLQDSIAHSGGYSNPTVHYATSLLSVLTILASGQSIDADATATRDMTLVEAALAETAVVLKVFRDKCFGCCK